MFLGGQPQRRGARFKTAHVRYQGTPQTVAAMRRLAVMGQSHPAVRRFAVAVIRSVQPRDYLSELAALYYSISRRVRYVRDPLNVEMVAHPALILQNRHGDCDDMATALAALHGTLLGQSALSIGNQIQFVLVGFKRNAGPNAFSHVLVRVLDPKTGQWFVLDPVAGPNTAEMLRSVRAAKAYDV